MLAGTTRERSRNVNLRELMADLDSRIIDDYFVPTKTRTIWEDFGDHTSGIQGIVSPGMRSGRVLAAICMRLWTRPSYPRRSA
jgi:hypothetical protein